MADTATTTANGEGDHSAALAAAHGATTWAAALDADGIGSVLTDLARSIRSWSPEERTAVLTEAAGRLTPPPFSGDHPLDRWRTELIETFTRARVAAEAARMAYYLIPLAYRLDGAIDALARTNAHPLPEWFADLHRAHADLMAGEE